MRHAETGNSGVGGWEPSSWLLAQDCHFGYGLAIPLATYAFHWPLWAIPLLLFIELIGKEGLFDQIVEKNPLVWGGLVDWSFYILGSAVAYGLLRLIITHGVSLLL